MKSGKFAAAEGVKLHISAVEQYIAELEKDKAALIEALKTAQSAGLCAICANEPKPEMCFPVDFDCAICKARCRCRNCGKASEHFKWKGREG